MRVQNYRGMTLLEVIIALAMMSVVLVTFYGMFINGFSMMFSAGELTKADYTDQQQIEQFVAGTPVGNTLFPSVAFYVDQNGNGSYDSGVDLNLANPIAQYKGIQQTVGNLLSFNPNNSPLSQPGPIGGGSGLGAVATLSSAVVDNGAVLLPSFNPSVLTYTVSAGIDDTITVTVTPTDNKADVDPPTAVLDKDHTTALITVTAENGVNKKTYTFLFSNLSSDATLASALVNKGAHLSPPFSPAVQAYSVVPQNKNDDITITVAKNDIKATLDKASAIVKKQDTTADFTVTAENGLQKVYHFVFGALNDDASLASVNLSKGTLVPVFSPMTLTYTVKGQPGDTITITPNCNDPYASLSPVSATINSGSPSKSLTVTAQDGTTQLVYSFNFTGLSSDASLSAIGLSKRALSPAFSSSIISYTVKGTAADSIVVTPICSSADATVSPASKVISSTSPSAAFIVTAEDGTDKTYTVNFVLMSSDATLKSIGLSEGTLSPVFNPAVTAYTVKGKSTDTITVTPVCNNTGASVSPTSKGISNTDKNATFTVTAEDGTTTKTYTVLFVPKSNIASLSLATVDAGSMNPSFSSTVYSYTGIAKNATVTVVPANNATVSPAVSQKVGNKSTVTFIVTSEDGTATKNYMFTNP